MAQPRTAEGTDDERPAKVEEVWIAVGLSKSAGRWFAGVALAVSVAGIVALWRVGDRIDARLGEIAGILRAR